MVKSLSKIKNSPTSSSEISSTNSVNVGHVSRSGRKIKPKKYSDYENESEVVQKRSRLSKENSKTSEKHNISNIETDSSSEQNLKTKGNILVTSLFIRYFLVNFLLAY